MPTVCLSLGCVLQVPLKPKEGYIGTTEGEMGFLGAISRPGVPGETLVPGYL